MVTGDNALTAISVARGCDIIKQTERIYLGDISEKDQNKIVWKDFHFIDDELDPRTLRPSFISKNKFEMLG